MTPDGRAPGGSADRFHVENDEFARIVLGEGFCTREQIARCHRIQSTTDERLSLGQSLLREGFLTPDQYSRVLVLLRQGYQKESHADADRKAEQRRSDGRAEARQGQEDRVLGGIVAGEGLISAGLLKVCLEEAAKRGRPLAEILVTVGRLESAQVDAILGRLERMEVSCPSCKATLSVVRLPTEASVRCPRCRNVVPRASGEGHDSGI